MTHEIIRSKTQNKKQSHPAIARRLESISSRIQRIARTSM